MLADVVAHLRCPHCRAALALDGRVLRCESGHAFDVARQGYVNLLPGDARPGSADTAAMVAARAAFLAAGHFAPLTEALAEACADAAADGPVLDVGAGPGHHLAGVLDALPARAGIALDLSRHAARRAARAHARIGAVVADAWRAWPVADVAVSAVTHVFAPRNPAEVARVLAPGGIAVVVAPTARHLQELVAPLGLLAVGAGKQERLAADFGPRLESLAARTVGWRLRLSQSDALAAASMGPTAHHVSQDVLAARVRALPEAVEATAEVEVASWAARS